MTHSIFTAHERDWALSAPGAVYAVAVVFDMKAENDDARLYAWPDVLHLPARFVVEDAWVRLGPKHSYRISVVEVADGQLNFVQIVLANSQPKEELLARGFVPFPPDHPQEQVAREQQEIGRKAREETAQQEQRVVAKIANLLGGGSAVLDRDEMGVPEKVEN